MLRVKRLAIGPLSTNCYIVYDSNESKCLIIDPADEADYIQRVLLDLELEPGLIIATHGHFDHILAATELQLSFNIPFFIHEDDVFLLSKMRFSAKYFLGMEVPPPPKVNGFLKEGESLKIGKVSFEILATPGHTPGSITLYSEKEKTAFVGDLVFAGGGFGRVDFAYSRKEDLISSITRILGFLPETKIYSGHGEPTTIKQLKIDFRKGQMTI